VKLMSYRRDTRNHAINSDISRKVVVDINSMEWQASPSSSVWRKRLHLTGEPESGQVTSIVRYDKASNFHEHEHPGGEEIFVLEGTFSDEHGDWPSGTYLLNPEGFIHKPYSMDGCTIFVKLRQYSGGNRKHIALRTEQMNWELSPNEGISFKHLYSEKNFPEEIRLEKWSAGASRGKVLYPGGAEILIIKGNLEDEQGRYNELFWLRYPAGAIHTPFSESGCEIYIKTVGLAPNSSDQTMPQSVPTPHTC